MDQNMEQKIDNLEKSISFLIEKVEKLSEKIEKLTVENKNLSAENKNLIQNVSSKNNLSRTIILEQDEDVISVKGEYQTTSKIKEVLKGNGAVWNRSGKCWKFQDKEIQEVKDLVNNACKMMNMEAIIETK